jgi:hypothetical protein
MASLRLRHLPGPGLVAGYRITITSGLPTTCHDVTNAHSFIQLSMLAFQRKQDDCLVLFEQAVRFSG